MYVRTSRSAYICLKVEKPLINRACISNSLFRCISISILLRYKDYFSTRKTLDTKYSISLADGKSLRRALYIVKKQMVTDFLRRIYAEERYLIAAIHVQ